MFHKNSQPRTQGAGAGKGDGRSLPFHPLNPNRQEGPSLDLLIVMSGTPEKFGKYALNRRLAFGGMAEIFLATRTGERGFSKRRNRSCTFPVTGPIAARSVIHAAGSRPPQRPPSP